MAASGAGALAGALYLASRTTVVGLGRVIAIAAAVFGFSLIAFLALSRPVAVAGPDGPRSCMGMMVQMAASNTVLQTIVDEDKRPRSTSFYAMAFFGTVPFGSLLAGTLAQKIGASGHHRDRRDCLCPRGGALLPRAPRAAAPDASHLCAAGDPSLRLPKGSEARRSSPSRPKIDAPAARSPFLRCQRSGSTTISVAGRALTEVSTTVGPASRRTLALRSRKISSAVRSCSASGTTISRGCS